MIGTVRSQARWFVSVRYKIKFIYKLFIHCICQLNALKQYFVLIQSCCHDSCSTSRSPVFGHPMDCALNI